MDTSIFIAKIFGLSYLVMGIGLLFNRKIFRKIAEDFCKNDSLVFFAGVFALIVGITIVLVHNIWVANWTVLVTVIGWAGLIKGVWIIVFPATVSKFMEAYRKNENLFLIHSIAALIMGVIFTFFGFFAG